MSKKVIQIAFAITLVIISMIGTIWQTELLGNIIYAVVIPSFILSVISFVGEIAEKCEQNSSRIGKLASENAVLSEKLVEEKKKSYDNGSYHLPYVEGLVPNDILDQQQKTIEYYKDATAYTKAHTFFLKCQLVCNKISIVGYVLLFLSLILSPYVVKLLSLIDLNCITLWSLTLLYLTMELKSEICAKVFSIILKRFLNGVEKDMATQE